MAAGDYEAFALRPVGAAGAGSCHCCNCHFSKCAFEPHKLKRFQKVLNIFEDLKVVLFGDAQRTCVVAFLLRGMTGTQRAGTSLMPTLMHREVVAIQVATSFRLRSMATRGIAKCASGGRKLSLIQFDFVLRCETL